MADINIVLGGSRKKKKPQVDNTLQPISQAAQARIQTDKIRTGTSTMQGANGFAQGYNGYKVQIPSAGYDKINPIISDITAKTKQYKMPEFDKNKSVLSNDWFNTALKRIQVHNRMKMDMKRRDALNSLLTGLIRSRDNVYDTTARVGARMRGQDLRHQLGLDQLKEQQRYHDIMNQYYGGQLNAKLRDQDMRYDLGKDQLKEQQRYHDIMNQYYGGQLNAKLRDQDMRYDLGKDQLKEQQRYHDILNTYYGNQINAQLRGQDIKENIATMRALQGAENQDDLMAQIKRMKSVKPDNFKTLLPDNVAENIDSDGLEKAYKYFVQTGKLPQFRKVENSFLPGYSYEPVFGESPAQQQGTVEANDNQATKPIGFDPHTGRKLLGKKVIDGKVYFLTENGTWEVE